MAADCWEADDRVARRPRMTSFRRAARLQQARWREAEGHPVGTQPIRPRPGASSRLVGSRLPFEYAVRTGANFVTPPALDAVRDRISRVESHQSIDRQRLWADLVWSTPLAFNLFGEVAFDVGLADHLVHTWFPDAPGTVRDVRFLYSPGRLDVGYLNSFRDFAVAFELDLGDGTSGIVAVDVKFFERSKAETPKPENMWRNREVAERSGVFVPGAIDHLAGSTEHCVMWLEHLLTLSMTQHPSRLWRWARYVVVYHPGNPDVVDLLDGYREFLVDDTTYRSIRLDGLLGSGALPAATTDAVRRRYLR